MLLGGIGLAVAGLTGLASTEYRARRWEEALMLGWSGAWYGLFAGLLLAAIAKGLRRLKGIVGK